MSAGTTARLAARNLTRSKRRTFTTMTAVVAGVSLSILGRGFLDGMDEALIVGAIDGTVGHVTARPADYPTRPGQHPLDDLLAVGPDARALLERDAVAVAPRTYFAPLVARGADSIRATAIGFDPDADEKVFPRTHWRVLDGAMPRADDEVGVSPSLASLLSLKAGDPVVLQVRTHDGAMNALEAKVVGVVRTGNVALDARTVWAPAALTRKLVVAEAPTHVSAKLRDRDDAAAFAAKLAAAMGAQASVVTWETETKELLALQQTRRGALNMVVFLLLALAAFGIANTVLMAAYERVREVGTLRAMGMTEGGVVALFLVEGGLIGLVGGAVGAALGAGACTWFATHPIDLSAATEAQQSSVSMSPLVYTSVATPTVVVALVLGVVVSVIASLYPARVAARMVPADAVRAS